MNTENNKLIAEFIAQSYKTEDGHIKSDCQVCGGSEHVDYLKESGVCQLCRQEDRSLNYHTSWDWLMPVVEKLKTALNEIDVDIFDKYVAQAHRIEDCVWSNDISSAHEEVVEVIKAYNKIKSS